MVVCLQMNEWSRVSGSNAEESVLVWIIYSRADIYTALVGEKKLKATLSFDYGITSLFQDGEMSIF